MFPEADFDMNEDNPWQRAGRAGMGILRVTLLFGSAAIALALLAVPLIQDQSRAVVARAAPYGIDRSATGSVGKSVARMDRYTVRRSILQSSPDAVCIISSTGRKSGDC